jgi:hypothetical protein
MLADRFFVHGLILMVMLENKDFIANCYLL